MSLEPLKTQTLIYLMCGNRKYVYFGDAKNGQFRQGLPYVRSGKTWELVYVSGKKVPMELTRLLTQT